MLAEFGCRYVIVGHSERRHLYCLRRCAGRVRSLPRRRRGPGADLVRGRDAAERDAGLTEEVVARQLDAVLSKGAFSGAVLAYEPVWAIGSGPDGDAASGAGRARIS